MKTRKPWPCLDCLVIMKMESEDFCKCPVCGNEVWFNYNNPDYNPENRNLQAVTVDVAYISRSLPEKYKVPAGGNKTGKRSKKKGTKTWTDENGYK